MTSSKVEHVVHDHADLPSNAADRLMSPRNGQISGPRAVAVSAATSDTLRAQIIEAVSCSHRYGCFFDGRARRVRQRYERRNRNGRSRRRDGQRAVAERSNRRPM